MWIARRLRQLVPAEGPDVGAGVIARMHHDLAQPHVFSSSRLYSLNLKCE